MTERSKMKPDSSEIQMPLCIELQQGMDSSSTGAKAANLGVAIEYGFRVPPGCVVVRQALKVFLEQTELLVSVQELINNTADRKHVEQAYDALCRRVLATPIPQSLIDELLPVAETLFAHSPHGLAVRSSGAHEDSVMASFAGVYKSFLGIRSVTDLWVAIRKCWCATWAPTAIGYTKRMGVTPEPDAMAVLIQQLIPADSAGVLFTADPQMGNPWRSTLESTFGLAQELVGSGGVTPADRFVFEWDTGKIIEKQIAEKPTMWVPGASGVENIPLSDDRRKAPSLEHKMAIRIAKLALEVDRAFECRVDIEWAVADGEIYVVQVRPITALPMFFPHHLPLHMADQTWRPASYWHFALRQIEGKVTPPLYRDLSIIEKQNRYQLGPIEQRSFAFVGFEADFNGHRYLAGEGQYPKGSDQQKEAYLREYEPSLRQAYLDTKHAKWPAMAAKATDIQRRAVSIRQQIEALLWARDAKFDLSSFGGGPSQYLFIMTIVLLRNFVSHYMPDYEADRLIQGHHPDLDPYYPHVQILEAEKLAQSIGQGTVRRAFEQMDVQELLTYLMEQPLPSSFLQAYEDYCCRFGLIPLSRSGGIISEEVLHLIKGAVMEKGNGVEVMHERATSLREACKAEVRQVLSEKAPGVLPRFEQLLDCALFWGPALNDRAWSNVPGNRIGSLWTAMCRELQTAGLILEPTDIGYFTAEDLAHIARTEDIEEGRRIWQKRRREYEHYDRLQAPAFLGKAPAEQADQKSPSTTRADHEQAADLDQAVFDAVIRGKGCVPGQSTGIACKVEALTQADTVTEQHVVLFTETTQLTCAYTPVLLSLMLRVRGMITQEGPTYMHHIAQIARECGVPIVQISPEDMAHIPNGSRLSLNGSEGTVTIQSSVEKTG